MPAFLAPLVPAVGGAAVRFLGPRALAAGASRLGASRLGAGALPTGARGVLGAGRGLSFAQFGAAAASGGNAEENKTPWKH
jgi:hypothetical protein